MKTRIIIVAAVLAASSAYADDLRRLQERHAVELDAIRAAWEGQKSGVCGQAPLPTTITGPVVTRVFTDFRDRTRVSVWRIPCNPNDSMVVMTMSADSANPYLCSTRLSVVQDGNQTSQVALCPDPATTLSFCGNLLTTTTAAILPTAAFPSYMDLDNAFTLYYDGGSAGMQSLEIPAYDPGAYGPPVPRPTRNYTGQWHNPAEPGHGLSMFQFGNTLFVLWFNYDQQGMARWFQLDPQWQQNDKASGIVAQWTGPAWGPAYSGNRSYEVLGDFTLEFSSAAAARLTYNVDGQSRTLALEKM